MTSTPFTSTTRARPSSTSYPSPPTNSAAARGVPSPPACSGQNATTSRPANASSTPRTALSRPSNRQGTPRRQALTSTGGATGSSVTGPA
ncbi:hypothetical protein SFR_0611 [Streptomyces sp. FR-008]|nr:hypothetical protein SFR_0611 [Streptomyces sp. FR-008]